MTKSVIGRVLAFTTFCVDQYRARQLLVTLSGDNNCHHTEHDYRKCFFQIQELGGVHNRGDFIVAYLARYQYPNIFSASFIFSRMTTLKGQRPSHWPHCTHSPA